MKASKQREVMCEVYSRWRNDPQRVVREYAKAEREGRVSRKSNTTGMSAEAYATALLRDGEKKGWPK